MPKLGYSYEPANPRMPRRLVVEVREGRVFYLLENRKHDHFRWWNPPRSCNIAVWNEWTSKKQPTFEYHTLLENTIGCLRRETSA